MFAANRPRLIAKLSLHVSSTCRQRTLKQLSTSFPLDMQSRSAYGLPFSALALRRRASATRSSSVPLALLSTKSSNAGSAKKSIEDTFLLKSGVEHVLLRPDTYVGSVTPADCEMPVFDAAAHRMVRRPLTYSAHGSSAADVLCRSAQDIRQNSRQRSTGSKKNPQEIAYSLFL